MTRVLIGNDWDEDLRADRDGFGWWVDRLVWFARDHDVLLLPEAPEESFLRYVTAHTGVDWRTLTVVVPPRSASGAGMLEGDRVADPRLAVMVTAALAGRPLDEVIPLWPHASVAVLAERLSALSALPGHAFIGQGGGAVVSSKAIFRAVSAGAGAPLPTGAVCANRLAAEEAVAQLIEQGHSVIVKLEYASGGAGNEVLSPAEGVRPVGARRTVVLSDRAAVRDYLEENWTWLTGGGTHQMVVERYFSDSRAYFAEFRLEDDGIAFGGSGELLSAPQFLGQIVPAELDDDLRDALIDGGRRICEPVYAMGYRGWLCADAIVTPEREVLFTEWNGRVTGSTHAYHILGDVVVGQDYTKDRVLLDKIWPRGWVTPSFEAMRDALVGSGLAYDQATRTGVIIVSGHNGLRHGANYCIVAPDIDAAWEIDQELGELFVPA